MLSLTKVSVWSGLGALALMALLVGTQGVRAGEEPVPLPLPTDPNAMQGNDKAALSSLDVDYVFDDNGRRDPFTFTKNVANIQPGENGPTVIDKPEDEPIGIPPEMYKKIKSAAEAAANVAEASLMDLDPNTAITKCDAGMEEFKVVPNLSIYPELEVVKGRLLRARKASEQMRTRQTAQRDFDAMAIRISGVMAQKKNSQAIINGTIVHKGSMIKGTADAADVMVDEIYSDRVVFVFKGYHMMLLLSDAGGK